MKTTPSQENLLSLCLGLIFGQDLNKQMHIKIYDLDEADKRDYFNGMKLLRQKLKEYRNIQKNSNKNTTKEGTIELKNSGKVDDKDTRVKKITLSNKALDRYYKGKEYIEHIENTVLKGISDEELKVFNNVLEKMTLNLKTNT